ncbi:MAG: CopG family transcriptional regulator [Alphaproteobacteria bacterium]|nr:CopG family transcriptional regulator [Alphaproteobacteria bacterium]
MRKNAQKMSITLSQDLTNFVNYYSSEHGNMNRSAIIQYALELLRVQELAKAYQEANAEIDHDFDICSGDGIHEER